MATNGGYPKIKSQQPQPAMQQQPQVIYVQQQPNAYQGYQQTTQPQVVYVQQQPQGQMLPSYQPNPYATQSAPAYPNANAQPTTTYVV